MDLASTVAYSSYSSFNSYALEIKLHGWGRTQTSSASLEKDAQPQPLLVQKLVLQVADISGSDQPFSGGTGFTATAQAATTQAYCLTKASDVSPHRAPQHFCAGK